jgi:hypothetical protein
MEIFDLSGFMCTITGELYCNTFPSICIYVGVAVAQFVGEAIPENRIFAQYHKDYTQAIKQHIISELIREVPKVPLTLATVALGMGIDAPSIIRIIHVRPPTTLEMMEFYVLLAPNPRIRFFKSIVLSALLLLIQK